MVVVALVVMVEKQRGGLVNMRKSFTAPYTPKCAGLMCVLWLFMNAV